MKIFKHLLLLSLFAALISCKKDDDVIEKELELSSELLNQTVWKGSHTKHKKVEGNWNTFFNVQITLTFISDKDVKVRWKSESSENARYYNATYNAFQKKLEIKGVYDMLDHWFLTDHTETVLVLESLIGDDDYRHVMKLRKVY